MQKYGTVYIRGICIYFAFSPCMSRSKFRILHLWLHDSKIRFCENTISKFRGFACFCALLCASVRFCALLRPFARFCALLCTFVHFCVLFYHFVQFSMLLCAYACLWTFVCLFVPLECLRIKKWQIIFLRMVISIKNS